MRKHEKSAIKEKQERAEECRVNGKTAESNTNGRREQFCKHKCTTEKQKEQTSAVLVNLFSVV